MKKLNEVFNLSDDEDDNNNTDNELTQNQIEPVEDDFSYQLTDFEPVFSKAEEISREIRDTEKLDIDFDDLSKRSMEVFELLVDIGQNIEDRHVANVFDVASKMMTNSISAKTHKMERKLKAINLQIQNQKAEIENIKLEQRIKERRERGDDATPIDGESQRIQISREDLIKQILQQNDK